MRFDLFRLCWTSGYLGVHYHDINGFTGAWRTNRAIVGFWNIDISIRWIRGTNSGRETAKSPNQGQHDQCQVSGSKGFASSGCFSNLPNLDLSWKTELRGKG